MRHLVQPISPRSLMLQLILSYQLKDLMNSFFEIMKVVSTDHKQANNLAILIFF